MATFVQGSTSWTQVPGGYADVWREQKNDYMRALLSPNASRPWGVCADLARRFNNSWDAQLYLADRIHPTTAGKLEMARIVNQP